jgi:Asp-tRNA(Asn)/Glu-tRNA(Gln) amidotransferase B subunit
MTGILILGANGQLARNTTILRPGWFTRDSTASYQLTQKGEPFRGYDVSLNSLSDLIVTLALTPGLEIRHSLGMSRT